MPIGIVLRRNHRRDAGSDAAAERLRIAGRAVAARCGPRAVALVRDIGRDLVQLRFARRILADVRTARGLSEDAVFQCVKVRRDLRVVLPRYPTSRMSARIACRTANWPGAILEPVLGSLWGKDAVGIFELGPLRRKDLVAAATAHGIDANTFIRELYARMSYASRSSR